MPKTKKRVPFRSGQSRLSELTIDDAPVSGSIDLEIIAAEDRLHGDNEIDGQEAKLTLSDQVVRNSEVFSDEDVLNLDLSASESSSEYEDPDAVAVSNDERIINRIKKTLSERILTNEEEEDTKQREDDLDWGKSKKNYYCEDSSDELDDAEVLDENADEATRLQKLKTAGLTEDDYFGDVLTELKDDELESSIDHSECEELGDGEIYAITDGFSYNALPMINRTSAFPKSTDVQTNGTNQITEESSTDLQMSKKADEQVATKVWPFIIKIPSVLKAVIQTLGPAILFCSNPGFLIERRQYKIYKLLINFYQTCIGYVNNVQFYTVAKADVTFPRARLREILKSCLKLYKLLNVYQEVLGIPISETYTQNPSREAMFKPLKTEVSYFLKNGLVPRKEKNPGISNIPANTIVKAPLSDDSDINIPEDCSSLSDSDSISDISYDENMLRRKHIPFAGDNDYGECENPASYDIVDELSESKKNLMPVHLPTSMESLVKFKSTRENKSGADTVQTNNDDPDEVKSNKLSFSDSDMELYDSYKDTLKKERKDAKTHKKKRAVEIIRHSRNKYIKKDELESGGKRFVSKEILSNRGLTPKRKREQRNPRVRKRLKYEKSLIKLKSIRPVAYDKNTLGKYMGELTGIKADLSRSVRLS